MRVFNRNLMMEKNMCKRKFRFEKEVRHFYGVKPKKLKMVYIVNNKKDYKKPAIYALYLEGKLQKIGKATYKGLSHRMLQYYNLNKSGGSEFITNNNKNEIDVYYFSLDTEEADEYWVAERRLQVIASDCGEKMPWEDKTNN